VLILTVVTSSVLQLHRVASWMRAPDAIVQPGLDFRTVIWAPARGLLVGLNPYAYPGDPGYLAQTGAVGPSSPRPPSILLLNGWLAMPAATTGFLLSVVLTCLLLWVGILLAVNPITNRQIYLTALLGTAVVLGGPADYLLGLGQTTGWAVIGFGLMMRWPRSVMAGLGLAFVITLPQVGVVLSLMLLALREWRLVAMGWILTLVLSLPGLALAIRAAGGPSHLVSSVLTSTSALSGEGNAENRFDVGWVLAGSGPSSVVLPLGVIVLSLVVLAVYRPRLDAVLYLGMLATIAATTYHMPYHVPLVLTAAIAAVLSPGTPWPVSLPAYAMLLASALSSFSLLWIAPSEAPLLIRGTWLAVMTVFHLAPVLMALAATAESVRRATAERDEAVPSART
jgi:hypothetical protein